MLIGGSFQLPTARYRQRLLLGLGDRLGLICPLLGRGFELDLGLGFDLRFGLGHYRLGTPIGGLFALGRIIKSPYCSLE